MATLDLRFNGNLNPALSELFNGIAYKLRGQFNNLVSELSEPLKYNLDWWVEGPASRNTLASPFFHYYCSFYLVDKLIKKNYELSEIIVDSEAFRKILQLYLRNKGKTITIKNKKNILVILFERLIKPFIKIHLEFFRRIYYYLCAHKTKHLQKPISHSPLILIDVFIIPDFISRDRYYSGLWENLSEEQKKRTFFVPTIVLTPKRKMVAAYKELRTAERNFLIKEDYLKINDLLFAIGHYFRILKMKISPVKLLGEDISSLICEEFRSMKGFTSAVDGILNYRFAKRLKDKNIKLSLVIDWFENQVMDKGWNAGFGKYYSNVKTIGYRGLVPARLSLSQMYPTEQEQQSKVLPSKVAVIGKGFIASTKKFARNLSVEAAPAFRFQHVWQERKYCPIANGYTILVALPIMVSDAIHILTMLAHDKADLNKNVRLWIKPHPTTPPSLIKKNFTAVWPKKFEFVRGDFSKCVEKSNLLISSASSACMETLAKGIPVIVVGNRHGLTHNPISETITEDIWRMCYSLEEIKRAIQFYQNRSPEKIKEHEEIGKRIREEYFEPVTREGVRRFLGLRKDY